MAAHRQADGIFDVAVIGAGVVGCAVARRLTLAGARVLVLERALDILAGASKGNSALLHTGFDAPERSLELECIRAGRAEYLEVRERLGLPLLETGAMVVAWSEEEAARLDPMLEQAHRNGVADARRLAPDEIRRREPHLAAARAALLVPGEHVVDPWSAPLAYILQAVANGATVLRGAAVAAGAFDGERWRLDTAAGSVVARFVVNCSGLQGDLLDAQLLGRSDFTIRPRKGQFVVFDKLARPLVGGIVLPVPGERTKGIVLAPTVFGNVLVGPTAEDQDDRDRAPCDSDTLKRLVAEAARLVPALSRVPVTAIYAGLRPATEREEYRICVFPQQSWVTVGGIRSTGLTAALGLARHVEHLYQSRRPRHRPIADPLWPAVPNLAEHRPRDWQSQGHGGIVCHCELVTRREIEAALRGPLPAGDLGGLKRRTRATLGRCQGFYCLGRVAALTAGRLADPVAHGERHHGRV